VPDTTHILMFLPAMLAITFLPGPDMLFVIAQTLRGGPRSGIASVFGIMSGAVVQLSAAALGLSALILKSATAFTLVKYAGAAYLIYLGIQAWRERQEHLELDEQPVMRPRRTYAQGFITNAVNPKVAVFMLAFLPQFVDVQRGHIASQILVLGAIWYATGFVVLLSIVLAAHRARLIAAPAIEKLPVKKLAGSLFIGIGVLAAIPERR